MGGAGRNIPSSSDESPSRNWDNDRQLPRQYLEGDADHLGPTSIGVTTITRPAAGRGVVSNSTMFIRLAIFGLLPTFAGILLLSEVRPWEEWNKDLSKHVKRPNPFTTLGSIFLPFGLLLILGGVVGFFFAKRSQLRQQTTTLYHNLLTVESAPLNLGSQCANANTGHPPFTDPPPPYCSTEEPPPPYQY